MLSSESILGLSLKLSVKRGKQKQTPVQGSFIMESPQRLMSKSEESGQECGPNEASRKGAGLCGKGL